MNDSYKKQMALVLAVVALLVSVWGIYHYAKKNGGVNVAEKSETTLPYLHGDNSFIFRFADDLQFANTAEEIDEELQETVVFSSEVPEKGFQIFIAPFDSETTLNMDDIKISNPDLDISNAEEILIDGELGYGFSSKTIGTNFETFEVWFVSMGKIYQVSTYPGFKKDLKEILSTWKWN